MSLSRSKRTPKPIKYFVPENDSSDDNDFCDFTPPSKKIKETKKKKKSKRDAEIKDVIVSNDTLKEQSPKPRLSLEERKFQKELEMAMKLSSAGTEPFPGFNKMKDEKENELESFSPLRTTVVDVEVHSKPTHYGDDVSCSKDAKDGDDVSCSKDAKDGDDVSCSKDAKHGDDVSCSKDAKDGDDVSCSKDAKHSDDVSCSKDAKSEIVEEHDNCITVPKVDNADCAGIKDLKIEVEKLDDPIQITNESQTVSTSRLKSNDNSSDAKNSKEKKKRKTVNFVDEESDGFSENDIEESYKSETDESDYFPSPSKNKRKKENKKNEKKTREKDSKLKDNEKRKPLSVTQISRVVKSPRNSKKKDVNSEKKAVNLSESSPKVSIPTAVSKVVLEKSSIPKSSSSIDSKSQVITKMPFQSPLLNSTNLSPKTPARIGLRLGLSRKASFKPLHPNASVK